MRVFGSKQGRDGGQVRRGFQSIAVVIARFGQRNRLAAQMKCIVSKVLRYRVGMASRDLIDKAGAALADAAGPDAKVILFGSYARGEEKADSDFDFLVIEPEVKDHFGESARLAKLVGELGVPADVVVASEDHVREWGGLSGTMIHDALAEGKIVGGRAA